MIKETLNKKSFRVTIALLVGLPATCVFFIAFVYGAFFGLAAIGDLDMVTGSFASATLLGTLGVAGAWLRLTNRSENFSYMQIKFIKGGLICGIAACLILLGVVVWADGPLPISLVLGTLMTLGILLYVGT